MVHSLPLRFPSVSPRFFPALLMAVLACAALTLAGCHHAVTDPKDPKFIVAEKPGQWQITRGELDKEIDSFLKSRSMTPDQVGPDRMLLLQTNLLDNMVKTKLLLAKAETLPYPNLDQEADKQLQAFKDQLPPGTDFDAKLKELGVTPEEVKQNVRDHVLIENLLKTEVLKNDVPTEQQIEDFYSQHKAGFTIAPKVRASRIVIVVDPAATPEVKAAKKAAIDAAHARVVKGEDFAKVAKEVSEDRGSAPQGGDLGFFVQGQNEAGFDDVAFHTKLNTVSPVFSTATGYEFLKVTDTHPSTQLSAAEAHDIIANGLHQQIDERAVDAYTKNLLVNDGVIINIALVDPTQGAAPSPTPAEGSSAPQTQDTATPAAQ